jgi:hypothetical protein
MAIQEIPLTADNQQFSIILAGTTWRISIMARSVLDYGPAERQRGAGNLRYSSRHGR